MPYQHVLPVPIALAVRSRARVQAPPLARQVRRPRRQARPPSANANAFPGTLVRPTAITLAGNARRAQRVPQEAQGACVLSAQFVRLGRCTMAVSRLARRRLLTLSLRHVRPAPMGPFAFMVKLWSRRQSRRAVRGGRLHPTPTQLAFRAPRQSAASTKSTIPTFRHLFTCLQARPSRPLRSL